MNSSYLSFQFQDYNEQCPYSLSPVSAKSQKLLRSPRKATRKISRIPFKVLDAPELQDDFYLNLVDWSAQNVLAVGLGSCVYLWSACTSQVSTQLFRWWWINNKTEYWHFAIVFDFCLIFCWLWRVWLTKWNVLLSFCWFINYCLSVWSITNVRNNEVIAVCHQTYKTLTFLRNKFSFFWITIFISCEWLQMITELWTFFMPNFIYFQTNE